METCTVETGLLKKKPCGQAAVTHCANCEQPLCKGHAVAQQSATGQKTGKFMCKECDAARKDFEKNAPKEAPAPAPAAPKPAAAQAKPEEKKPDDGAIEFTPDKK